jgi:cytochrome c oxidase subunit 1
VTHEIKQVATAEDIVREQEENADKHIHMPSPSYWPIVLAGSLPIIALGLIYAIPVAIVGGALVVLAMYGWSLEPSTAPDTDFDPPASGEGTKELAPLG